MPKTYSEISGELINFVRTSTAMRGLFSTNSYEQGKGPLRINSSKLTYIYELNNGNIDSHTGSFLGVSPQ